MKVMAGRTLTVADANVAEVYFIPRKYKFWSRTGLQSSGNDINILYMYMRINSLHGANYFQPLIANFYLFKIKGQ